MEQEASCPVLSLSSASLCSIIKSIKESGDVIFEVPGTGDKQ